MATIPIVTELTKAELDVLVAANGLNEGLQYKVTDKGWLLTATSVNTYIFFGSVPYLTYSAILTQNVTTLSSGELEVGKEYWLGSILGDDDFSNVGYEPGRFIATGTTPTKWTNSTLVYDVLLCTPVANVLHNTIGNAYWTWNSPGIYSLKCNNIFTENKCSMFSKTFYNPSIDGLNYIGGIRGDIDTYDLISYLPPDFSFVDFNYVIDFEMRIYQ